MLNVFLRTHDTGNVMQNLQRCVLEDKRTMIQKCIRSLLNTLDRCSEPWLMNIVDDHSSPEFLAWLDQQIQGRPILVHHLEGTGNNASAEFVFELCHTLTTDLCYVVEDDFFHHPDAIARMVDAIRNLGQVAPWNQVAVYPYDCPDRYIRDQPQASKIFYNQGLYWRTLTATTWTVMTTRAAWDLAYPTWKYAAQVYTPGGISEEHTINLLYNNGVMQGGPITCYSPIPSLAIHLEFQEPTSIQTGFVNWRSAWTNFRIPGDQP